jgi:hypothetical protein
MAKAFRNPQWASEYVQLGTSTSSTCSAVPVDVKTPQPMPERLSWHCQKTKNINVQTMLISISGMMTVLMILIKDYNL